MESFFSWLGAALGALFVVAAVVAWWEHLLRSSRPDRPPEPVTRRAVSVDVQLDVLPPAGAPASAPPAATAASASPLPSSDAAERRAALEGAMSRMARVGHDASAWTETSPMVLHASGEGPAPVPPWAPAAANAPAPTSSRA